VHTGKHVFSTHVSDVGAQSLLTMHADGMRTHSTSGLFVKPSGQEQTEMNKMYDQYYN
jgi:hypothetical protein